MMNVWRIPLLFFVSRNGGLFCHQKKELEAIDTGKGEKDLNTLHVWDIFIVPIHLLIWQKYYIQDLKYSLNPGHLWFLANIFIYVVLLSPVFFYLKRNEDGKIIRWIKNLLRNPLGILLIVVPFILEALIVKPEIL